MKIVSTWFCSLGLAMVLSGCQRENAPVSSGGGDALKILNLTAAPDTIQVGATSRITVQASATEGVQYRWQSDAGFFVGSGAEVQFGAASCCVGLRTITCTVSDAQSHTASSSVQVLVQ